MATATGWANAERLALTRTFLSHYERLSDASKAQTDRTAWVQLKFSCTREEAQLLVDGAASPETMVEKMRREVAATVAEHDATVHRAIDRKYNLLRVSERRWSIVRVSSVAAIYHGVVDVVTFEQVTKPLDYESALRELKERRSK